MTKSMWSFIGGLIFIIILCLLPVFMGMCFSALMDQVWTWPWEWVAGARLITGFWLFILCPLLMLSVLQDI